MSIKWKCARTECAVAALVAAAFIEPIGSSAALAQTKPTQIASLASGQIENVVVTAERRSESAQSVPISITALTSKQLDDSGIQTTQDLVVATPGLTMTQTLNGVTPYIRGVGSQQATTEGAVAVYVDNVYYASTQGAIFMLNDVDRVEVLKGPQGTLFGRNATGGLINVITRDPSYAPEINGSIGYGNYDTLSGDLYVTGGITKNIAMDFSAAGSWQGKGWGKNYFLGNDVNLQRQWAVRSKVKVDFSANTKAVVSVDYSRWRSDIGMTRQALPGTTAFAGVTSVGTIYDTNSNLPSIHNTPNYGGYPVGADPVSWQGGVSLKIVHDFSDSVTLSSLSAFRWVDARAYLNTDLVPMHIGDVFFSDITHSFQQDLILNGTTDRLKWTAGLNFYRSKMGFFPVWISSPNPAVDVLRYATNYLESYAGFGQGTYDFGEGTSLTMGLRYTVDRLHAVGDDYAPPGDPRPVGTLLASTRFSPKSRTHKKWDALTWRIALNHKFTDDIMAYASYSKGYKSGAFNPAAPPTNAAIPPVGDAVGPEKIYAYEVGIKSEFFDHRLRANGALFYYDYQGIQLLEQAPSGVASTLFNAKQGNIYGGELELVYAPPVRTGDLQIRAAATLLDPQYGTFTNAPVTYPKPGGGDYTVNCQTDPAGCVVTGNQMVRAPRISSSVGLNYSVPVSDDLEAAFNVSWQHSGKYYFEVDNRLYQPAYDLVNSQISLGRRDGTWRFTLWVRNLGDTQYYVAQQSSNFGDGEMPAPPRTFGAKLDFLFD